MRRATFEPGLIFRSVALFIHPVFYIKVSGHHCNGLGATLALHRKQSYEEKLASDCKNQGYLIYIPLFSFSYSSHQF